MDTFLEEKKEEKIGGSKVIIAAVLAAIVLIAAGVGLLFLIPTSEERKQEEYAGAVYEGSPEFENYTKQLIITTDFNRTSEATLGVGTIHMAIHGTIRNKGTRAINLLEVKVGVVDQKNQIVKEKKVLIIPGQYTSLQPGEIAPVFVALDGFKKDDDRANVQWKVTAIRFQ